MMGHRSLDDLSGSIVDAAYQIHRSLGPGLLESVYESVLARGLEKRGLAVERQKQLPFEFDGQQFNEGLRLDLLVEAQVIVEVKSAENLLPVHSKQLLTYLRLTNLQVGLLVNFGAQTMKEGLRRIVNHYVPPSSAAHLSPRLRVNKATEKPSQPSTE